MAEAGPNQRFVVRSHERDDESYMYSYTDYSFAVASAEFGDELETFSGRWDQTASGDTRSGVEGVSIAPDGSAAVAHRFDGGEERVELPRGLRLVDGGRALELTWADGRVERRPRRPVVFFTKYGEPVSHPLVGEPPER